MYVCIRIYTHIYMYIYVLVDYIWKLIPATILVSVNWALSENGAARIL